jgi:long-subunit fatty acid transport protein
MLKAYTPKAVVADMSLSYLTTYYRINERNTIGASLRYFSIGDVNFADDNFQNLGIYNPNEFAFDVNYARSFGPEFSLGGSIRFIYSNLYAGRKGLDGQSAAGKALAANVSGLYKTNTILFGTDAIWSVGVNISNIGTKMSYSRGNRSYFLPGNFKIGTAATLLGNESKLIIALDFNKLLVPTEPIYSSDGQIVRGKDPNRSVPAGIFGSFTDAPGGFSEELKEIGVSTGLEFAFKDKFAFRTGYNYQNPQKGDSNYFTVGAGFKYNRIAIDLSYLVGSANTNPLANTIRFGL